MFASYPISGYHVDHCVTHRGQTMNLFLEPEGFPGNRGQFVGRPHTCGLYSVDRPGHAGGSLVRPAQPASPAPQVAHDRCHRRQLVADYLPDAGRLPDRCRGEYRQPSNGTALFAACRTRAAGAACASCWRRSSCCECCGKMSRLHGQSSVVKPICNATGSGRRNG